MDNLYTKFQPLEQSRWNQCHIDTLFYAGCQNFVNQNYGTAATNAYAQWYFNICQQPCNLITGYQRQHRKNFNFTPIDGADSHTTDQYNSVMTNVANRNGIHEAFSKGCELSTISGMCIAQPYLDFNEDDQLQGSLKLKIWEYNSFMIDPYFREPNASDANYCWFQEYITKEEAEYRFPDKVDKISPMGGSPQRYGRFYFLPEQQNMTTNNLFILSYIWYKSKRKRKKLYSASTQQFFDISVQADIDPILQSIPDLEIVTVTVPTWKVCIVLNDQLMHQCENPLGFDRTPFVPIFWNYEPHVDFPDLRVRGLIRSMRDPQYLFNLKVAQNNDIVSSVINSGWKRKSGAVANEDNLKKTNGGWDVIINNGFSMTDVEKIIPTALPESDLALASQMQELMFSTSGIQMENWAGQEDKQISALTAIMKQAANLMVFQKYFDQWDYALKQIGDVCMQIIINNWNAQKVALIINEEPSPLFFSKIFAKYDVIVEESLLTPTQRNLQARQMLEINQVFGREVIPASMIIKDMNIHGKNEILEYLQQQEMQASQISQQQSAVAGAFEEAKLQELHSRALANLAMARERHGRAEADIGLFEERLSEISRNRALATKDKMEAMQKLMNVIEKFGEIETMLGYQKVDQINDEQEINEDREKLDAKQTSQANQFVASMLKNQMGMQQQNSQQIMR